MSEIPPADGGEWSEPVVSTYALAMVRAERPERPAGGGRTPTSETGVYLSKHTHDWIEIGAERWPSGDWRPVFQCVQCTDIICDLHVDAKTGRRD